MDQGFIPDSAYAGIFVSSWQQGTPQQSFWHKTKVDHGKGIPIGVFKCIKCGYLEMYASPSFAAV